MKSVRILVYIFLFLFISFSCNEKKTYTKDKQQSDTLQKANWLLGNWEYQSEKGILTESWKRWNDSILIGESFFIVKRDTIFRERMQLIAQGCSLNYMVTVYGQNESNPITFILTKSNAKQLVFENSLHDFPQKIIYNRISIDSLQAEIFGKENNKLRRKIFRMKRIRN